MTDVIDEVIDDDECGPRMVRLRASRPVMVNGRKVSPGEIFEIPGDQGPGPRRLAAEALDSGAAALVGPPGVERPWWLPTPPPVGLQALRPCSYAAQGRQFTLPTRTTDERSTITTIVTGGVARLVGTPPPWWPRGLPTDTTPNGMTAVAPDPRDVRRGSTIRGDEPWLTPAERRSVAMSRSMGSAPPMHSR